MTDLEITRLCTEVMGYFTEEFAGRIHVTARPSGNDFTYAPLTDDAQMVALGKSDPALFSIVVREWADECERMKGRKCDLNRLVCTAFAVQQQWRTT